MDSKKSRAGVLIGVAAAAGAFGAAAMMSTATAPTARADDLAAIEADISGTLADGQTAFGTAVTDFESSNVIGGLASLFDAVDDDTSGVSAVAYIGGVEELTNEPFSLSSGFSDFNTVPIPTSFSDAVSIAESYFTQGEADLSGISTLLSSGEYGDAATIDTAGTILAFDLPVQELLIGGLESLGL